MMNRRVRRRSFLGYAASAVAALGLAGRSSAAVLAGSVQPAAGQSPTPGSIRLSYLAGSTVKIEQLIGDFDKQLQQPTLNQTNSRYGLVGTDLGNSFEHNGKVYFLFGDNAAPGARDPMGFTQSTDPDGPLQLDFVSRAPRSFIPVGPPGVTMGPFETPLHGISLDSVPYVTVSTSHSVDRSTDKSLLTRFDEGAMSFATVREISHLPDGRFIKMTLRLASQPIPGLPGSAPYVLIFGSGEYRKSNAYLAAVPAASFTSGENTRYCAGLNGTDPAWSDRE
ncbi:MAG: hypothetical protein QOF51_3720, partial [Chloroflexota bacterium]|nr:hypothetical protein [Chloroflexota bacterium]